MLQLFFVQGREHNYVYYDHFVWYKIIHFITIKSLLPWCFSAYVRMTEILMTLLVARDIYKLLFNKNLSGSKHQSSWYRIPNGWCIFKAILEVSITQASESQQDLYQFSMIFYGLRCTMSQTGKNDNKHVLTTDLLSGI